MRRRPHFCWEGAGAGVKDVEVVAASECCRSVVDVDGEVKSVVEFIAELAAAADPPESLRTSTAL